MEKETFVPLYRIIYETLRTKLRTGEYPPGSQLPSEHELCQAYDVRRVTIRRALDMLVADSLIEKRAGRGSFAVEAAAAPPAPKKEPGGNILFAMQSNQNDLRHNATAFNALLYFPTEQACKDAGYTLLYASVLRAEDLRAMIDRHDIVGIFLVSTIERAIVDDVCALGVPVLCINAQDDRILSILPDNVSGSSQAVARLVEAGHRRIAHLGGIPASINAQERLMGYTHALVAAGLAYDPALVSIGHWTFDGSKAAVRAILERMPREKRPTAIFAASDMMAIGAMDALREMGYDVPGDVSVIGFDNIEMCTFCTPALTSVLVDSQQMASIAVEHMVAMTRRGARETDHYTIRLPVQLIERASTRAR